MITAGEKVEKQEKVQEQNSRSERSGHEVGKETKWKYVESQGREEKTFQGESGHLSYVPERPRKMRI